jgi:hypothetical protein
VSRQTTTPQQPQSLPVPQVPAFLGQHSNANGVADTMLKHLDALIKTHQEESSWLVAWSSTALDSFALLILCLPGMFASISETWTYNCVGVCYFVFLAMTSFISLVAGFYGPRAHQPPNNNNNAEAIGNMENGVSRLNASAGRQQHHLRVIIMALELTNFILLLVILFGQPVDLLTSCACASVYPSFCGFVVLSVG